MNDILVIRNTLEDPYIDMYTFMSVPNIKIEIINSQELYNYSLVELANIYDKLILLGGPESITEIDKYPYLYNTIKLIHLFNLLNKPILGICLGLQLLVKAFNGQVKKLPSINIGCATNIKVHNETEFIKKSLYNKHVLIIHEDYVNIDNTDFQLIATYNNIPYIIQKNNILGVQFHPDVLVQRFILCINKRNDIDNKKKESIVNIAKLYRDSINEYNNGFIKKWINE